MGQDLSHRCRIEHRMDFQQGLITTVHDYGLGNLDALAFNKELSQANNAADSLPDGGIQPSGPGTDPRHAVLPQGLNRLVIALAPAALMTCA